MKRFVLFALALTLILAIVVACGGPPPTPTPVPPAPAPPTPVPPPPPTGLADLAITSVTAQMVSGQTMVTVWVQNLGQSTASGVEGTCDYSCIGQQFSVTNQSFLQGGYLVPGKQVSGLLGLSPCPDAQIQLSCIVDPGNSIPETDELNNAWTGFVKNR